MHQFSRYKTPVGPKQQQQATRAVEIAAVTTTTTSQQTNQPSERATNTKLRLFHLLAAGSIDARTTPNPNPRPEFPFGFAYKLTLASFGATEPVESLDFVAGAPTRRLSNRKLKLNCSAR